MPQKETSSESSEKQVDWSQLVVPITESEPDEIVAHKEDSIEWGELVQPIEETTTETATEQRKEVDWSLLYRERS